MARVTLLEVEGGWAWTAGGEVEGGPFEERRDAIRDAARLYPEETLDALRDERRSSGGDES